jgi:hypothetical protein
MTDTVTLRELVDEIHNKPRPLTADELDLLTTVLNTVCCALHGEKMPDTSFAVYEAAKAGDAAAAAYMALNTAWAKVYKLREARRVV